MSEEVENESSFEDLVQEQENVKTEEYLKELDEVAEVEEPVDTTEASAEPPELTALELAKEKGYDETNHLHGSPDRFLEAIDIGYRAKPPEGARAKSVDEYIETGVLIDKLKATADENKEMRETLKYLKTRFDKQDEEKVLTNYQDLEQQRIDAVSEADVQKVFEIEQKQKELRESLKPTPAPSQVQETTVQAGNEFLARNSYLTKDTPQAKEMLRFAVAYEETLLREVPNDEERLGQVEKMLKKTYAEVFSPTNPQRQAAPKVTIPQERKSNTDVSVSYPGWTNKDEMSYKYLKKDDVNYTREKYFNQVIKTR